MKIMEAEYDFPEEDWANVSESAKHFISQLLTKNPNQRMAAADALKHRWLNEKHSKKTEENLNTLTSLKNMKLKFGKLGFTDGNL
jgi:serine/threonine protein kinase